MLTLPRPLRWAGELLLVLAVFAAALPIFFTAKAKIDSDEGNWIGTTRYFETFFVERDFSPQAWADGYWPRTQPMVFRYVIGSWLWYRGHDLAAQNPNYDFNKSAAANRRLGLAPADDVLDDARMPARLMAALAVTMLYAVVRLLAGPIGGLVAATFAAGSPYLQEHFVRAKAESTLMFFLLGALLLAILSVRLRKTKHPVSAALWGVGTGTLLGLAFGTKLTTVLAIVAVAAWGISQDVRVAALATAVRRRLRLGNLADAGPPMTAASGAAAPPGPTWVWPLAVMATTAFVFIVTNPFLWPNPVTRSWLLFENRRVEMAQQQKDVPSRAVHALDRRVALVWERSVYNDAFAPSRLGWPLESVLTVVGAGILAARAVWPRPGRPNVEWMVFLWLACLWAGVSAGLGFLLQHYFVPTAMIATLLSGLAVGWGVQALWHLAVRALPQVRAMTATAPVRAN